jgi:peptidoglycan/LPS O-acetylase OafA/YrhL
MPEQIVRSNSRIHYLDSIRGIAALMVVIMHFIGWKWGETLQFKLASFIFNGTEAVSFFFVLSGFVLSYTYVNTPRKIKPFRYLYKRVLRLYPAYIVNVLLLFLYYKGPSKLISSFPYKELLMFQRTHHLYLPGWTLRIEVIYSVIILGLIFLYRKQPYLLLIPFAACYVIGPPDTSIYMNHFLLGILLSILYPKIKALSLKDTKLYAWRWAIYTGIFVLFSLNRLAEFIPLLKTFFDYLWTLNIQWTHFSGLAAFLFLLIVITSKNMQAFLEKRVLLYLGKISYSIYLVHWGLCVFIMDYWDTWAAFLGDGPLRFAVMFLLYLILTIAAADLMYRYVEAPFIRLSKREKLIRAN